MNWKEFKEICKLLRKESDRLTRIIGEQVWSEFHLYIDTKTVLEINPYAPNLSTGNIDMVKNIMSGRWLHDFNVKERLS